MSTVTESERLVRTGAAFYAATLRERGWCQGAYSSNGGAFCLRGVMLYAEGETRIHGIERAEIAERAKRLVGTPYLIEWNDAPGRTADEVITVFDRIANGEGRGD